MSDEVRADASSAPVATKRHRVWRVLGWIGLGLVGLVAVLALVATWYTGTEDFQRRVGGEVVSTLENATGGRVELQHLSFSLWHLAIEADGLVIHGSEAPGEMPYLSASKILLRIRIHMFLTHIRGLGAQSRVSLRYLRVEQPRFHLIVDKNGHSNAPVPKHKSTSNESVQDTLLDLQARKVELADGLAVINDRAIPFNVAAKDLKAEVHWERRPDQYGTTIDLGDLQTKLANEPEVQSKLHIEAELGRDKFALKRMDFSVTPSGGTTTQLTADALVEHFASPQWQATVKGNVDVKQLGYLTDVPGLYAGTLDLAVHGHSCVVTPQVAQKNPRFWQRHKKVAPSAKVLPPDPNCAAGYLLVGAMKMHNVGYRDPNVRLHDINGGADLHITPTELLFTALSGYLPGGGDAKGQLKIENWLGETPANAAATSATTVAAATTVNAGAKSIGAKAPITTLKSVPTDRAHAYLTVVVEHIPLRTIMDVTAPEHYGDLGFDTSITGPTTVEWGGPATDISDTVQVQAHLTFAPTGVRRKGAPSNVPISGEVVGHYDGSREVVNISALNLHSVSASLTATGVLGVNVGDPLTNLQVNLDTRDLGEFDQLLQTLAFTANGKKGAKAIPVVLHGNANFVGTAKGAIRNIDVKGHVVANDLSLQTGDFGSSVPDVHIDSVVGNADYSPNGGVAVASSTITRGTAVLNLMGTFKPHRAMVHGVATYLWDKELAIDASAKLANAQVTDVLQIAGVQPKVPVTGTMNLDLTGSGTIHSIIGGGSVTLANGVAYGESYQKIDVNVAAEGKQVSLTKVLVQAHGLSVTGSAGYNLDTKQLRGQVTGNNLQLSKFDTFKKAEPDADGVLSFTAIANGTLEAPDLHARMTLANISMQGKQLGGLELKADSTGSTLAYQLQSKLVGAQVNANGETSLVGDYDTKAKLTVSGLDIANVMAMMGPGTFKGSSVIAGTVTVAGPAAKPKMMTGTAEFNAFDFKLQGVELKAAEPVRASLRNGTVTLDQIHVTGQDTDLVVYGTAVVFGDPNPQGGRLAMHANGNVSVALASTLDPVLISSGKVTFNVAADGRMKKPTLTGNVLFKNVNLAIEGVPNGLSNLNGTLVFNEDRLDVQNMTAQTGGGQLKIGGYLAYQKGFFADLTATGDVVRIRYNGLSATANASLRLQGQPQSLLLSGNVLVTRFGVGADVDFAALSASGGVQAPPDPGSLMNKIRLDVHVTSSPQLDFQNSFAKLAGSVDLTVRGTLAVPSVLGRIQITDGSATYLGVNYELERGTIYFSNPVRIDPTIDLDATARVENYDLTIGVHGTVTNLKPTYRSEPPLTEADIFNLLALGRTQEEAQLNQEQQTQMGADPTTDALLGGALNATVSSRVGKLFGAGSVKIDPAFIGTLGNSSARITVQEPLSKQVTLVFATNVNETAQQLIQVQYRLSQEYSLVATRDESGVFSIVFKIRKRYK